MICPKCTKTGMEKKLVSGVEIDLCPECEGVWLDWGEAVRLRAHLREYDSPMELLFNVIKKHSEIEKRTKK